MSFIRPGLFLSSFVALSSLSCTAGSPSAVSENTNAPTTEKPAPEKPASDVGLVGSFDGVQVTGVTVSEDGRKFANFPRWREDVPYSVVEIAEDGSYKPYPDKSWNKWNGKPQANKFTCVQSVVAHGTSLFVLDPASPMLKGTVSTPTLFEFDLAKNKLLRKFEFDSKVAPPLSYLNDIRFDKDGRHAYITESGLGAIIVLDLQSGKSRRLLSKHPSTKSEPMVLVTNGKPTVKENGLPQKFNADGIAIDDQYLYYHVVTGYHLYRVSLADLKNENLRDSELGSKVEDLGLTPAPDGMIMDPKGNLIMADLERNAIVYRTPAGELKTLVQDPNIHWIDTFAIDQANQQLIFTDSRLDEAGPGRPAVGIQFNIHRIDLPAGAQ